MKTSPSFQIGLRLIASSKRKEEEVKQWTNEQMTEKEKNPITETTSQPVNISYTQIDVSIILYTNQFVVHGIFLVFDE